MLGSGVLGSVDSIDGRQTVGQSIRPLLSDLLNLARADAGCADPDPAPRPVHQCANRLQIQVPAALSYIMGVTDPVAELGPPATNFTNSCHKTKISLVFRRTIVPIPATSRQVPCRPVGHTIAACHLSACPPPLPDLPPLRHGPFESSRLPSRLHRHGVRGSKRMLHREADWHRDTILVVEDSPAIRKMVCAMLTQTGYNCLEANDGAEALRLLQEAEDVRLVLTDVIMPNMDGTELARQLSRTRPELRILFMSGYVDDSLVRPIGRASLFLATPF